MSANVLSLDLGTGGCKASIFHSDGRSLFESFRAYPTVHPHPGWNEQRTDDWWSAIVSCVQELIDSVPGQSVDGISASGHSLGMLLLDSHGQLLESQTPIWSDTRAVQEAKDALVEQTENEWYLRTGNGFTPSLYPSFKALWYAKHRPDLWSRVQTVIGSKDWVNYRLTGQISTDFSYASGSGVYDLRRKEYADDLIDLGGLKRGLLPEPIGSHEKVGSLTADSAAQLGLTAGIPVYSGAVDNAAMALGSRGTQPGRAFAALGSSSWITVTTSDPVLDVNARPYVFAHAIPDLFVSALSTFSSGTSIEWLKNLVSPSLSMEEFVELGATVGELQNIPTFIPTLAGGTPLEGGANVRGVIAGLDLGHRAAHLARAGMEGIALSLRQSLKALQNLVDMDDVLLISGGGGRSQTWNQLYSDFLEYRLLMTDVDQQAAALGAAAIAFVGLKEWSDYSKVDHAHSERALFHPNPKTITEAGERIERFERLARALSSTHGTFEQRNENHE